MLPPPIQDIQLQRVCDMIHRMRLPHSMRKLGDRIEGGMDYADGAHSLLYNLGWVSAGVTALALGLFVGRELRERYKFNRRTPYDMYAHAGDRAQDIEFGVGI